MNLALEKKVLKQEIDRLEDETILQAIKTILNSSHQSREMWLDGSFETELKQRSAAFISGTKKRYTWEEAKVIARKAFKSRAKKSK